MRKDMRDSELRYVAVARPYGIEGEPAVGFTTITADVEMALVDYVRWLDRTPTLLEQYRRMRGAASKGTST